MLKHPFKTGTPPFPWRTVTSAREIRELIVQIYLPSFVINSGVYKRAAVEKLMGRESQFYMNHFHGLVGYSFQGLAPETRRFLRALVRAGAKPRFSKGPPTMKRIRFPSTYKPFGFWFDVSSRINKAYYVLNTGNNGTMIHADLVCLELDETVIEHVRAIDAALHALVKANNAPEVSLR